jgi:hypothetical protein
MSLSSQFIEDFDPSEPDGTTKKVSVLDDHIRMMKYVLDKQLGSLGALDLAVSAAELNWLTGVTSEVMHSDQKNVANGIAGLDSSADVPLDQIPDTLTGKEAATAVAGGSSAFVIAKATNATQAIRMDNYASTNGQTGGTVKMRVAGSVLYIRNDGNNA